MTSPDRRGDGPGDRRGRADRLAHRRPADRRRGRRDPRARQPGPRADGQPGRRSRQRRVRRSSKATSATARPSRRPWPAATTSSTRRPSASRCAPSSRATAWTCWSVGRSTSSRRPPRRRCSKVVYASSASVYGAADEFPTDEQHHPYNNRTLYGAAKLMNEGIARHFHDMNGLPSVGPALLQRVRPADGRDRGVHRGLHPLARLRRGGSAAADPRRRVGDDGLRLRRRRRPRQPAGDASRTGRRRLQRRERDRDVAVGALAGHPAGDRGRFDLEPEFHPPRKVNPVPRRLADTTPGQATSSASPPRSASTTACGNWPPGATLRGDAGGDERRSRPI